MLSLSFRFRRKVPEPAPVLTQTVRVLPLPFTLVTEAPERLPLEVRAKSNLSTPVTGLVKVTVKFRLAAALGLAEARVMEETWGGMTGVAVGVGVMVGVSVGVAVMVGVSVGVAVMVGVSVGVGVMVGVSVGVAVMVGVAVGGGGGRNAAMNLHPASLSQVPAMVKDPPA